MMHDWWCACVAAAFGRIVCVREATMLYRQHGANVVGARDTTISMRTLGSVISIGFSNMREYRELLRRSAAQAAAFLDRYASRLSEADREFLAAYARIPERGFMRRKVDVVRLRALPGNGELRLIGTLIRA
jgi:hypothetical protein